MCAAHRFTALIAGLCWTLLGPAFGEQENGDMSGEARRSQTPSAAAIDFGKEYGLNLARLGDLGHRIDEARQSRDPIALYGLSSEVGAYEKISGKVCAVTAEELAKEAVETAMFREHFQELRVLAILVGEQATQEKLSQLADAVEKRIKDREAAAKAGETSRGVRGRLIVDNRSRYYVHIRYNDNSLGWVSPFSTKQTSVGDYTGHSGFKLSGHARGLTLYWGPSTYHGDFSSFTWKFGE